MKNHAKESKTRFRKAGIKNKIFSQQRCADSARTPYRIKKPIRTAEKIDKKPGPAQNQTPNATLCTLKPSKKFAPERSIL